MKTLLEFLSEEKRPLYQRILPAIKYKDGHVAKGSRTDEHEDIRRKMEHKYDPREGEAGFWHPDKKEFVSRQDASSLAPRGGYADSSSFRTADEKEKTKMKVKRRGEFKTASAGSMSSGDRLGKSYDLISAHRAGKYGAKNEFQFGEGKEDPAVIFRKKVDAKRLVPSRSGSKGGDASGGDGGGGGGGNLEEGNPLATMHKHQEEGRHFIALSTERPGLSKRQVRDRNKELMSAAREAGYGVRKSEGRYEGGKETSHVIHAKAPGRKAGAELVAFGRRMGQKYDQDSILHHNSKTARLIGTNETGFPGKDKSEKVGGKLKFNNPESPFQTELRPSKKRSPARFTTE